MDKELDYYAMGTRIRQCREALSMTQTQLGDACSLSTAHIGHVERGTRTLSIDTLYRLAKVLHASTDYLLYGSVDETFSGIQHLLHEKQPGQVKTYTTIMKLLADHIDEL